MGIAEIWESCVIQFPPLIIFQPTLDNYRIALLESPYFQQLANTLIQSGAIQVEPLISHQLPLSDFVLGMELAEKDPKRVKVHFVL